MKINMFLKKAIAVVCAIVMLVSLCSVMGSVVRAESTGKTVTTPQWTPNEDLSVLVDDVQSPDPNAAESVLIAYGEEGLVQINVDMGGLTTINQINLFHNWQDEGYRPTDIAIDVQYEDGYWERVAEKHNISWTNSWDTHVFVFKTVEVKAVRITTNNARNGEGGYRLNEIEFCNYAENASEDTWTGIEEPDDEAYAIPAMEPAVPSEPAAPVVTITTPQWTPDDLSCLLDGNSDPNNAPSGLIAYGGEGLVQIDVSFGELKSINQINLFHNFQDETYRPSDLAIDVQYENGLWERVAEKHNITELWPTGGGLVLVLKFKTVEVQAVRITTNNARNGEGGYRLNEIEFECYAENESEDVWTGIAKDENDAYNIPAMEPAVPSEPAAPVVTITTPQWTPDDLSCLLDGNFDPNSAPSGLIAYGEEGLVQIDVAFGELKTINQINLFHNFQDETFRPSDLAIDVQYENGLWERVAEKHNITELWPTGGGLVLVLKFKTVEVQAVRITTNNARNGEGGYRLNEIEFECYAENESEDVWTGIAKDENDAYNIPAMEPAVPGEPDEPEATEPEATEPEATEPEATEPEATEPEATEPEATEPTKTVTTPQWTPDDLSCLVDGNFDPNSAPSGLIAYGEEGLVQIDVVFGELKTINQINLFHNFQDEAFRPSDLAIDVQYANGLWERVVEKHNITELWPTGNDLVLVLKFKTVEVQAVRITTSNARNGEGGYRLNEIEFECYAENESEDVWTGIAKDENDAYNIPLYSTEETPEVPETSDDSMIFVCCMVMMLGFVGVLASFGLRKKVINW